MTTYPMKSWNEGTVEGLVQLSDHALYLRGSGPTRSSPETPAIVIEHGLGSSHKEWVAVERLLAKFARVYVYERAGYFPSDQPKQDPIPANIAADLHELLHTANVKPPYLLVGHSYGGTHVRQFLADHTDEVYGMVLVDASPLKPDSALAAIGSFFGDTSYEDVVGLSASYALTPEEVRVTHEYEDKNQTIAELEDKLQYQASLLLLNRTKGQQLLGDRRLCVIYCHVATDLRKIHDHAVKHNLGTAEERASFMDEVETIFEGDEAAMRDMCSLSKHSKFVTAQGKAETHNVHTVDPELVVQQIQWVLS